MPSITKDDAEKIADKLQASIVQGSKHDLAKIYHNDRLVAQYGIQRGSKRDASHSYITSQIFVSKRECLGLSKCTVTREQWIAILIEKGLIETEGNEEEAE